MPHLGWSEDPIRGECLTWGGLRIPYVVNASVGGSEDPIRGECLTWVGLRIPYVVDVSLGVV